MTLILRMIADFFDFNPRLSVISASSVANPPFFSLPLSSFASLRLCVRSTYFQGRCHERLYADKDENSVHRADSQSALGSSAPEPDASSGGYFRDRKKTGINAQTSGRIRNIHRQGEMTYFTTSVGDYMREWVRCQIIMKTFIKITGIRQIRALRNFQSLNQDVYNRIKRMMDWDRSPKKSA